MYEALAIGFEHADATRPELTGGKGVNLARMTVGGLPVPPGFVVTTAAHAVFLTVAGLGDKIRDLVKTLDFADAAALEDDTAAIRELIANTELPAAVVDAVLESYAALGAGYVAVRSSGVAEDLADASFAGLHDTYLDIRGEGEVLDAVRSCWASVWTARAAAYRHQHGFEQTDAGVAVVIQTMVEAEVAGVLFTANPMNARVDEFVVNASYGLGESVVSGVVDPDEYVLAREEGRVKRSRLGTKETKIVRDGAADHGTVELPMGSAEQREWSLSPEQLGRLAALGRRVQDFYGGFPQDIEWALLGDDFVLLQARPVTGADFTWDDDINADVELYPEDDDAVWTHAWADEFWTGAITPLFFSVRAAEFSRIHRNWQEVCGFEDIAKMQYHRYRRGTAYFNTKVDIDWYTRVLPPQVRGMMTSNIPPDRQDEFLSRPFDLVGNARMYARIAAVKPDQSMLKWFKVMDDYMLNRVPEADGPSAPEWAAMSDDALRRRLEQCFDFWVEYVGAEWCGFFLYAPAAITAVGWIIQNWYQGDDPGLFTDLLMAPQRTKTMEEMHDLWGLAGRIKTSPLLTRLLAEHADATFFDKAAEHGDDADVAAFLADYQGFVSRNFHRGHADRDFIYPRRIDDPTVDVAQLQALVSSDDSVDPALNEQRMVERRLAATDKVIADLRSQLLGSLKVEAFKAALRYVHRFLVLRDDERHYVDRITYTKKVGFIEIGRRLVERGVLEHHDDFYFLAKGELFELLEGRGRVELSRAKIAARRRVFDDYFAGEEVAPQYIRHGLPVAVGAAVEEESDASVLKGVGTSRGVATGTARVIRNARDIGQIAMGEILVCPATDPGWTPVFMVIKGLVMESGGTLAHGSCLSREYGLPAVTVPRATKQIPDGATITVDGNTGEVRIHDEDAEAAAG